MKTKFVCESLADYMFPDLKEKFDLLEEYDIQIDIDGIYKAEKDEYGEDSAFSDYEDTLGEMKEVTTYPLIIGNSIIHDFPYNDPNYPEADELCLVILINYKGKKYFQFYFSEVPLVTGSSSTLIDDPQPLESLNKDFVEKVISEIKEHIAHW